MSSAENKIHRGFRAERAQLGDHAFHDVLRAAFDYRGNVTLAVRDGELEKEVEGYLYNLDGDTVDFWPKDDSPRLRFPESTVQVIIFSGRDTAEGKSWEAWVKKYETEKGLKKPPHPSL